MKKDSTGELLGILELVDPNLYFHLASDRGIKLLTLWVLSLHLDLVCDLACFWPHGLVLVSKSYSRTCDGPFLVILRLVIHKNGKLDTPILLCMNYCSFYEVL